MTTSTVITAPPSARRLEQAGLLGVCAFAAAVQFSLAAAEILLWLTVVIWFVTLFVADEAPSVPRAFWPLGLYVAATFVSVAFSLDPHNSLYASKQMLLLLVVPMVYRFARGERAGTVLTVILTIGALSAILGVVEYGILGYTELNQRVHGSLGHWMTYSGLLLLVTVAAIARLLFSDRNRVWPALIMPALVVAIAVTMTRGVYVGTCVAFAVLVAMKDLRFLAAVPIVGAAALVVVILFAPASLSSRFYSVVNLKDPTSSDRISMIHAGVRIVRDYPLTGVGLDNIKKVYRMYRDPNAIDWPAPHLHNVPLQIAAERGLPALAVWLWFVVALSAQLLQRFRLDRSRMLAAVGIGAIVAMLVAGLSEYNFGDSEFLMLFLVVVTLPFAAEATQQRASKVAHQ